MPLLALSPRVWVLLALVFLWALALRWWRGWRAARRARQSLNEP